ncbi:HAD family hydrolase [Desulfospira joergensenii]|uniref:HAD family hydrolase n=1 Tax=Desulfospira joergensenii TaxID=53329 RepID=UPI0003B6B54B|nr:HAD family hydrolase [Desulfospira joergensenii]
MNILFDLDGTLTDPFTGISRCISYALETLGRKSPSPKDLAWCIGPPLRDSFIELLGPDKALAEKALTLYRERFTRTGMFENSVYEGIPQALRDLEKRGHTLFVATSKPWVYAEKIIRHFELHPFFKTIYGCELDGTRGDKTSLISHVLKEESLSASSTVMVGDTAYDMEGAENNGISGIGVLWGYGSRQDLEAAGAGYCIGFPRDLAMAIH